MTRNENRGFTLVEVLVSVSIFAILAALAYGTLNKTADGAAVVTAKMVRLQALQRSVQLLAMDFVQLSPRPVREALADEYSATLIADIRTDELVEMTRGGWSNPLNLPRPGLQRVAYMLEDRKLYRRYWPVLDRTLGLEPNEVLLLDEVDELKIRYLPPNGEWTENWPPSGDRSPAMLRLRPRAVEFTLILPDFGEIRRVIEVTG